MIENPSHLRPEYLAKYAVGDTFIETGTYHGDTVNIALAHGFKRIHTIELNVDLFAENVIRFKDRPEVKVWHGDSVDIIPEIVESLTEPSTFWLDAHASGPLVGGNYGPCPLELELRAIFGKEVVTMSHMGIEKNIKRRSVNTHTIFVGDRRLLGTAEWGFVSEEQIVHMIMSINPEYKLNLLDGHVEKDVIVASVKE